MPRQILHVVFAAGAVCFAALASAQMLNLRPMQMGSGKLYADPRDVRATNYTERNKDARDNFAAGRRISNCTVIAGNGRSVETELARCLSLGSVPPPLSKS